jgi:5-methyltetrahydropteroyltriglutamate--homocysteine methyltransferase
MGSRILIHNLGYPRIGAQRQLKKALEKYWADPSADLTTVAATLRSEHWLEQKNAGVDLVTTNDFSLYDHVLDTIALVGAVPERLGWGGASVDLATYFAMARGQTNEGNQTATAAAGYAMEMTKWFDTNYHYIVPEFWPGQRFSLASRKVVTEFLEARKLGLAARLPFSNWAKSTRTALTVTIYFPAYWKFIANCSGAFLRLERNGFNLMNQLLPVISPPPNETI